MPGERHYFGGLKGIKPTTTWGASPFRGASCVPAVKILGFAACCVAVKRIYSGHAPSRGARCHEIFEDVVFRSLGVLERSRSPKPGNQRQHLVQGSERSRLGEEANRAQRRFHDIGQTHGPVVMEGSSTQLYPKSRRSREENKTLCDVLCSLFTQKMFPALIKTQSRRGN